MPASAAARRSDDEEQNRLSQMLSEHAATHDRRLRNQLADAYDDLAVSIARHFSTRRESTEDLVQVARIGLLGAIERFDPCRERPFGAFARATIIGELKRHLRDRTWTLRVPRSLQEQWLAVVATVDELTQERGRSPLIREVAARAGLSEEHVLEAMELGRTYQPAPLEPPARDETPAFEPPSVEEGFGRFEDQQLLSRLLDRLPPRERLVVKLRFEDELTQAEIGERIGLSQMSVSRMLGRVVEQFRSSLLADTS